LNGLFELGAVPRRALRHQVFALLARGAIEQPQLAPLLCPLDQARIVLPATVGDYTDFYAGIHHATTVGALFRPDNPLLPNYKWVPIGYHGRASTIQPSEVSVRRPLGQIRDRTEAVPAYRETERLDFELELGVWIGPGSQQGQPIPIELAAQHVAGYCLLNDWSARDVQAWEYQPLGPFLSKNFATTVSAWVITPEALAPYRIPATTRPAGDPDPLPYLTASADQLGGGLDLELEVQLSSAAMRVSHVAPQRLALSSARHLYWTVAQLIAHHTSGGCDLRPGDLLGTGTISAPTPDGYGSLLELTHGGRDPITLPTGETRTFLQDGDEVILRGRASRPGAAPIGFGECRAVVQPAPAVNEPIDLS
jgi:fumarylacetoacetase